MATESARDKILSDILEKITAEVEIKDQEIITEEIPCTGKNYTAAIYLITIKDKEKGKLELFAKVAKANEGERKAMQISEMYKRERFVYLELVDLYNDLQEKHKISKEDRYEFAKHYASNPTHMEETIILENLTTKGYHTPDRFEPMDWIFAAKAVSKLAKFHALSFVLERENPKQFDKFIRSKAEFIYTKSRPPPALALKYTKDRIHSAMECLTEENTEKFKTFLNKVDLSAGFMDQFKLQRHPCLVHGDYKHTNLMIKSENGKLVDLFPVDYQGVYYGSPINDLLYFIFTGSDEKFRERYFKELLDHYYSSLSANVANFAYKVKDIYPRKDFEEDLKDRAIYGLYIGVFILPYMLAVKKPDFSKKVDEITIVSGVEYRERFNGIINDFAKWGYL